MKVTLRHALGAGHCRSGVRAWCDANGIDIAELKSPGIEVSVLRAIGDRYATEVADYAEAEEEAAHG